MHLKTVLLDEEDLATGVMTPYRNAYFLKEKLMFNFFLRFDFGYSGNERLRVMDDNFFNV